VASFETDRHHSSASRPLRIEAIGDVVVVTPLDPNLLQTMEPDVMREELAALIEKGASRRVVLNLEHSGRVSSAALGVFVAFHLRLDRLGGALRLCQPHARMAQFLDQIRLPLLMDIFPTKEEAVLSSWEGTPDPADRG
jgi:anti-anti-sigma factor